VFVPFNTGVKSMTATERAWIAGVLEGSGDFVRIDDLGVRVQLRHRDEEVLRRLRDLAGLGTVSGPFHEEFARAEPETYWRYVAAQAAELKPFLAALEPHFGPAARDQVERARAAMREGG